MKDNELPRYAGLSLIALVIGAVMFEFAGFGTIGDARLKILLTWSAILLMGNEARQILLGGPGPRTGDSGGDSDGEKKDG